MKVVVENVSFRVLLWLRWSSKVFYLFVSESLIRSFPCTDPFFEYSFSHSDAISNDLVIFWSTGSVLVVAEIKERGCLLNVSMFFLNTPTNKCCFCKHSKQRMSLCNFHYNPEWSCVFTVTPDKRRGCVVTRYWLKWYNI